MVYWKIFIITFLAFVKHGISADYPHTTDGSEDENDTSAEATTKNSLEESFEDVSELGEGEGLFPVDLPSGEDLWVSDEESAYDTDYSGESEDYEEQEFSNEVDNYNSTEIIVSDNTIGLVNGTDGNDNLMGVYMEHLDNESNETVGNSSLSNENFELTEDHEIAKAEDSSHYVEDKGDDFDSDSGDDEIRTLAKKRDKRISKRRDWLNDNFTIDESIKTPDFNASYDISTQGNVSQTEDENELTKKLEVSEILLKKSELEEKSRSSKQPLVGPTVKSLKTDRAEIETSMNPSLESLIEILAESDDPGEDMIHRRSREINDYEDEMGNLSLPTSANQERPSVLDYPNNSGDHCNTTKGLKDGVPVKVMYEHISKSSKHIILDLTTSGKNDAEKWSSMLNGTDCKTPLSESDSLSSVTVLMDSSTGSQSAINTKSPDGTSIIIIDLIDSSENNSSETGVDETEVSNRDHVKPDSESALSLITLDSSQNLTKEQENDESYENRGDGHLQTENCFIFAERDLRQIIPRTVFETIASAPNSVDLVITENSVEPLNNSHPASPGDFSIFYNEKGYYMICTRLEERELLLAFTEIKRKGSADEKSKEVFHFHVPENKNCLMFLAKDIRKIIPETILEKAATSPNGLSLVFTENSVAPLTYSQPNSLSDFSISTHSPDYYTICTLLSERELLVAFALIEGKRVPHENVSDSHPAEATETENCFFFTTRDINKIIPKSILEEVASTQTELDLVFNGNSVEQSNHSQPYSMGNFSISVYSPDYFNICTFLSERELLLSLTSIKGDHNVDEKANVISTPYPPVTLKGDHNVDEKANVISTPYPPVTIKGDHNVDEKASVISTLYPPVTLKGDHNVDEKANFISTPYPPVTLKGDHNVDEKTNVISTPYPPVTLKGDHNFDEKANVISTPYPPVTLKGDHNVDEKANVISTPYPPVTLKGDHIVDEKANDISTPYPPVTRECFNFTARDLRRILPSPLLDKVASKPDGLHLVFSENSVEPLTDLHEYSESNFSVSFNSVDHYTVCITLTQADLFTAFSLIESKKSPDRNIYSSHSQHLPETGNCFNFTATELGHVLPRMIFDLVASTQNGINLIFTENSVEPITFLHPSTQADFSLHFNSPYSYTVCTQLTERQLSMAFTSISAKQNVKGNTSESHDANIKEVKNCFTFTARDIQKIIPEAFLKNIRSASDEMDFVFTENSVEPLSYLHPLIGDFSVSVHSANYYKVCTLLNEGKLLMAFSSRKSKQNRKGYYVPSYSKSTPSKAENCFIFAGKDLRQIVPLSILEEVNSSSSRVNLVLTKNSVEPQSYVVAFSQGEFSVSSYSGDYYSVCTILNENDLLKAFGSIKGKTHKDCSEYHTPNLVEINALRRVNGNFGSSLLQGEDNETLPKDKCKTNDGPEDDEKRLLDLSNSGQKADSPDKRFIRKCNLSSGNNDSFDHPKNQKPALNEKLTSLGQPGNVGVKPVCSGRKDPEEINILEIEEPEKTELNCHNDTDPVEELTNIPCNKPFEIKEASGNVYVFPILVIIPKPYEYPLVFGREGKYEDPYKKIRLIGNKKLVCCEVNDRMAQSGHENAIRNQFGKRSTLPPISGFSYPWIRNDWLSKPNYNKRFENGPLLFSLNTQPRGERVISVRNNGIDNHNDFGNNLSYVWGRNGGNLYKETGKGNAQIGMKQNGLQKSSWEIAYTPRMNPIYRPFPQVYPYISDKRSYYPEQDIENFPGWKDSKKIEEFRSKSKCRKYPCKESEQGNERNSHVQLGNIVSGVSHEEISDDDYGNNNLQFISKYEGEYNPDNISDKMISTENYAYGIYDQYAHDSHEGLENQVRGMNRTEANVKPSFKNESVVNSEYYLIQSPDVSGDNETLQIVTEEGETYNEELPDNKQLSFKNISDDIGNRLIMPDRPVNLYASRAPQTYTLKTHKQQDIQTELKPREIKTKREISSNDKQIYAVYSNDMETSKIGLGNINGKAIDFGHSYETIPQKVNVGLKSQDYGWYDSYKPQYTEDNSLGVETLQPSSSDLIYSEAGPEMSAVYRVGRLPYPYTIE